VLDECRVAREGLASDVRARVHLACLPMDDSEENAAVVNALQRHARVVCQKSIAEGFGLTVAEAMWKGRPVVASRVGGIQDQIQDGVSGILIENPRDLDAFGAALALLMADRELGRQMGLHAQRRVRDFFLGPRHLIEYLELFSRMIDHTTSTAGAGRIVSPPGLGGAGATAMTSAS
jgi:trehalose synthase